MKDYLKIYYSSYRKIVSDYDEKFVDHLVERFKLTEGKLLDIGCGTKRTMNIFHKKNFKVYGVDKEVYNEEKNLDSKFEVKYLNLEKDKIAYEDNFFDVVFCKSVIEHVKNPLNIFNEAYRVLKPGGIILVLTPSWRHTYWGPFYIDSTHVTPFTESSLYDCFLFSKFKNISVDIFYQFPLIWKFNFLKLFCKFIALFPLPYFPLYKQKKIYSDRVNTLIRFSNEPLLLGYASK